MLVVLKRGQIGRTKGIDITAKSSAGWATVFAPTWEMVSGHKDQTMGDIEYAGLYTTILDVAGEESFKRLWQTGLDNGNRLTLLCYCPRGVFCHTHLLIDYAVRRYPQLFQDGRTRQTTVRTGDRMRYLLAIDLETTGLKPGFNEITQIAAILMDKSLNELGSFDTLVSIIFPERGLENNFNVFEYTGIRLDDLAKAPPLKDALRALETFTRSKVAGFDLKNIILFGQNPAFDKGFLEAAYEQQGWKYPFDFHVLALESMYAHQHILRTGEVPSDIGLKDICKAAGVENRQKHNAMSDIRATVDSLHRLCPTHGKADAEASGDAAGQPAKGVPRRRNAKKRT
jgi:DNA polymerase III epsilon subunit-like protein